jgi:hypothetical protein
MKVITTTLYVCGSLMLVATVMGAIDYSTAQKKGTIKKLYKEEPPITVEPVKKEIDYEDYSRGEINRKEPVVKKQAKSASKKQQVGEEKIDITEEVVAEHPIEKKEEKPIIKTIDSSKVEAPKKKIISFKRFSRGPLREEKVVAVDTTESKAWQY